MNEQLILLAIQLAPEIIDRLRELFKSQNPDAPSPTDAEVITAYQSAFVSSLAKDEKWLDEHPEEGGDGG
jgi:hypothetical protein